MRIAVVVGNPKLKSRTLDAGVLVAQKLAGREPDLVVDLVDMGPALLEFGNADVAVAIQSLQTMDVVVFASPTFKATYTGLMKLFLDQFPPDGLAGVIAFPVMLGAGPAHFLAPELLFKPVLVELGATCPVVGLYLIDKSFANDPRLEFLDRARQGLRPRRKGASVIRTVATSPRIASGADFKRGMRKLAAGVNVVTVCEGDALDGLTATAACSISADPPHLLVCVNATAGAHGPIQRAGAFCLNVLSEDQIGIARRFAGMDGSDRSDRFGLGHWTCLSSGAPALDGALASFDCLVVREIVASTHTIFIGRVLEVRTTDEGAPLIYHESRFVAVPDLRPA